MPCQRLLEDPKTHLFLELARVSDPLSQLEETDSGFAQLKKIHYQDFEAHACLVQKQIYYPNGSCLFKSIFIPVPLKFKILIN